MFKKIVGRPVTIIMFFIATAIFGIISFSKLPVNLLPNIKYPSLTVWTEYPGNSPEEIENEVTSPLEASVGAVKGIKNVYSISRDGISLIKLDFEWGTDMDFSILSVREKLDAVSLPDACSRPNLIRIDPSEKHIMALSVTGDNLYEARRTSEMLIKKRLEQLDGVALADIVGGGEKEIRIEIKPEQLTTLGIALGDIETAIKNSNIEQTGGKIKDDVYLYELKISSEFKTLTDIENCLVKKRSNGQNIFIKDIAKVVMTAKEKQSFTRYNGKRAVGILIRKDADANTVKVSEKIREIMDTFVKDNPQFDINIAYDQATFITESIDNVISAILYGGILAFLTLFLFLKDFKTPFNIALSIPISILSTFSLLYFVDITLNLMSLSGLALGVGMLVDNSIVILENITRHKEMNKNIIQASIDGTKEVAMPVTASTITTIIVFMPIVFVSGVAGELFKEQSIAVTFSLLSSLVVSLTLLPVLISRITMLKSGLLERGEIDDSIKSKKSFIFSFGIYWFTLLAIIYSFLLIVGISESTELMIYTICLASILDPILNFIEILLGRSLHKENEKRISLFKAFLAKFIQLIILLVLVFPAIYSSRIDLFEPLYKIFAPFKLEFIDTYLTFPIMDFSNMLKNLLINFEEEMGTDQFVLISYSIGFTTIFLNLTPLFSFSFISKIDKDTYRKVREAYFLKKLATTTIARFFKFIFGTIIFWIKVIIKIFQILFKPILILFDKFFEKFKNFYHLLLLKSLENRTITLMIVMLLLASTYLITLALEKRMMPEIDSHEFIINIELPVTSGIDRTEQIVKKYEQELLKDSAEVISIFANGGIPDEKSKISGSTVYKANIQVKLADKIATAAYLKKIRNKIKQINAEENDLIKVNYLTNVSTLSDYIKTNASDVNIKVFGNNLVDMEKISEDIVTKLKEINYLTDIKRNFISKKPKIDVKMNEELLENYDISSGDIDFFISTLTKGRKISKFNDADKKIDIILSRPKEDMKDLEKLRKTLYYDSNNKILLDNLIKVSYIEGPEAIGRDRQQRFIEVSANIENKAFNEAMNAINKKLAEVKLYKGNKISSGESDNEMKDSFKQLVFMFFLSIILVYMVLASQFESLLSPFIIIFAIPLSLFGVALGLFITGQSLNVMSMIGIIILIGIVVNDAIVKVDFIDKAVASGKTVKDAILEAGEKRLRPILMTTITTVFGMIPMAIGFGGSSELRKPLAVTVIFGLSFATMLTLIVIPVIYSIFKRDKK